MTNITVVKGDLPNNIHWPRMIAVDTETTGLDVVRDRLCLVQIGDGKGNAWLIQIQKGKKYPNLKKLLQNPKILKIFHYARFDVAKLKVALGIDAAPIYCTKIAHKLVYPDKKHSLKSLCEDMLGVVLDKEQQCSDWGHSSLTEEQIRYAANDVMYLHALKSLLDKQLKAKKRDKLAATCFQFMNTRAELDILGYEESDLFSHH